VALFVLDASAYIALEVTCTDGGYDINDILDLMTDLAATGCLKSPPLVLQECKRLGKDESATRWLRASSGHFSAADDSWEHMEAVLTACPALLDPDDLNENPQVAVLALALHAQDAQGQQVIIVTDQWVDNPLRQALGNAAAVMSVTAQPVEMFIENLSA
jgi:hypothetical protein